jgi:predicted transcriptional regulator
MDLHRRGRAAVGEVMAELTETCLFHRARALRVLEEKGHIRHEEQQLRYVYLPAASRQTARRSALNHLLDTFFEGSPEKVVEALLGKERSRLSDEELDRMAQLIETARKEGKRK